MVAAPSSVAKDNDDAIKLQKIKKSDLKNKKPSCVSPKGSAYSVICRLIDKTRNLNSIDDYSKLIPKELIDEIGKEDKRYGKHKKKYDYEKQFMLSNIYHDNDSDIKKPRENIRVHKRESLKYALGMRIIK